MARIASEHGPEGLRQAANLLSALLHPDGDYSDDERARRRGLTLANQQSDGMSRISGWVTPETRAALASHAFHYLAVFDKYTGETLHLGRSRRCASPAQRIVLFSRDRGCTRPGCTASGYQCESHHAVADWKNDGQTDVNDLTLACGPDNRMIENSDWIARKRADGRTEWIPPPALDTGQARVNDLHHPERMLTEGNDDP